MFCISCNYTGCAVIAAAMDRFIITTTIIIIIISIGHVALYVGLAQGLGSRRAAGELRRSREQKGGMQDRSMIPALCSLCAAYTTIYYYALLYTTIYYYLRCLTILERATAKIRVQTVP